MGIDGGRWRAGRGWRDGSPGRPARHGRIALAVFVLAIQVIGAQIAGRHQSGARPLDALGYGLLIAASMALPARLRWRLPVFVFVLATTIAYVLFGYPYGPVFLGVLLSIFGAVRTGHRVGVWISLGIGYATFVLLGHAVSEIGGIPIRQPGLGSAIAIAAWTIVACVVAEGARARTAHFAEVAHARSEQARARAEQERRQASEERLRIARELHDVLGHHLSLINVQAGVGLHLMDAQPEQARVALEAIKQASAEALGEVRTVLGVLRPKDELAPRAPAPSLANLAALVDPAGTVIEGPERPLPPEVDRAAFRIVQESLTNVRRHAGPDATATVTITYGPDHLRLRIADDGPGRAAGPPESDGPSGDNGIAGMRTRAGALGGTLAAGPGIAGGFVVSAVLPLHPDVPDERQVEQPVDRQDGR